MPYRIVRDGCPAPPGAGQHRWFQAVNVPGVTLSLLRSKCPFSDGLSEITVVTAVRGLGRARVLPYCAGWMYSTPWGWAAPLVSGS